MNFKRHYYLMPAFALFFLLAQSGVARADDTDSSDIAELEQSVAAAKARLDKAEIAYEAAMAEYREAQTALNRARGSEAIRVPMGIPAYLNAMEADNNMFGTGGGGPGGSRSGDGVSGGQYSYAPSSIILGSMDKSAIDRVVKQDLPRIQDCYRGQPREYPEPEGGRVEIKFTVALDGTVSSAEVHESTLDNDDVEQCICNRFRLMRFPQPKGGGIVIETYPLVFK